jgi:hypothetical protein
MIARASYPISILRLCLASLLLSLLLVGSAPVSAEVFSASAPLDLGYRQMYNLEFQEAHNTFREWQRAHPGDPLGLTSDAAAYLFAELDRLEILQTELFVDNDKFKERKKTVPNPAVREEFEKAVAQSDRLADAVLARAPKDGDALFAKVLNLGLRADYLALIDKRDLASLSRVKSASRLAEQLLAADPGRYDAYLAVGVENYILGLKPAPVRWFLRLYGAQTDKDRGIKNLRLTAEKGHYLQPYARLLLAVAALRDNNRAEARTLLGDLAHEFPQNRLYQREFARLQ